MLQAAPTKVTTTICRMKRLMGIDLGRRGGCMVQSRTSGASIEGCADRCHDAESLL